jgi:hypothetical protein
MDWTAMPHLPEHRKSRAVVKLALRSSVSEFHHRPVRSQRWETGGHPCQAPDFSLFPKRIDRVSGAFTGLRRGGGEMAVA